jgi:hypothetical protein
MERAERGNDSDSGSGITAWIRALFTGSSVGNVDFLSTHPASGKRIKASSILRCVTTVLREDVRVTNKTILSPSRDALGYGGEVTRGISIARCFPRVCADSRWRI